MKKSYLFLATGFEEIEALGTTDALRRAGMDVKLVSISEEKQVCGAHGIVAKADYLFNEIDCNDAEWLICPGGMPGASNLIAYEPLVAQLKNHADKGGKIAAICAAPAVVLATSSLLRNRKATAYPGFEAMLEAGGAVFTEGRAVVDGNIVTANSPGSTFAFARAIITVDRGAEVAAEVMHGMLVE
ncbi:MAG: DJ-1/PfpI family protein [Muribaculaceae bacterium]|nr:DJ-1/PfpI family protein [Muribaculaceae bacterium]